jgi:oxygen-independent coproporphyrinogen-3 oxidase
MKMFNPYKKKVELGSNPGLYVHVPFCSKKCPYCSFYSIASPSLISIWIEALKKEIDYYEYIAPSFDSLYLGGGTPTCLTTKDLEMIIGYIYKKFTFTDYPEVTIEANPNDLNKDKIHAIAKLGFNRINVGAQSFNDEVLSFLGRTHSSLQTERALSILRSSGFNNIGLDLIYGFKKLPLNLWKNTLERALEFEPAHLSCYQLSYEKGTLFGRMKNKGKLKLPSETEESLFFKTTSDFLQSKGYIHYEVSNYSKGIELVSRHNWKYWNHVPYFGLGPSAHSFDCETRWWNVNSIRDYCHNLDKGSFPIEGYERLSEEQKQLEKIALGFRTNQGFHTEELEHCATSYEALSTLKDSGFLVIKKGRVMPTVKGFLVADYIPIYLFS